MEVRAGKTDLESIRARLRSRDTVEMSRHARDDLIALVLEVERLRAEVESLRRSAEIDLRPGSIPTGTSGAL